MKTAKRMHKVHIFWKGHKILRNLLQLFDWQYIGEIIGGDIAKSDGLLGIYELYQSRWATSPTGGVKTFYIFCHMWPLKGAYHVCSKCTTYRILRDIDPCYIKGCRGFWWVRFVHLFKYIEGEKFFQLCRYFKGGFFFRKWDSFFKSTNLPQKNISKN